MSVYVAAVDGMTSHDAADVTRLETSFLDQEGVVGLTANDLLVQAQGTPDMTVKVNPGSCFVLRDAYVNNDQTLKYWNVIVTANTNITINSADPSNPRIDAICVKIDTGASPDSTASNVGSLVAVAGTPAGSPTTPTIPNNHLLIATVRVDAGVTTIVAGKITDARTFVGFALPYAEGYRLKDTGASLDAQVYEDSSGVIHIKGAKSGGEIQIDQVNNKVLVKGQANETAQRASGESSIEFVIGDGTNVPSTGVQGYLEVPFNCTIQSATITADVSGSAVIDIWQDTYANYPPTIADTITASAKPTLSTAIKNTDSVLTGWTKNLLKGSWLGFNLDSVTTCKRIVISLKVNKT